MLVRASDFEKIKRLEIIRSDKRVKSFTFSFSSYTIYSEALTHYHCYPRFD